MSKLVRPIRLLLSSVGTAGSLFVKKTVDGKYEVALAPIVITTAIGSIVTCAVQKDEPFRQCVRNTMIMLEEVIHAN